jgi:RNA polymerase sigma-70 factor (ECF subfamily)
VATNACLDELRRRRRRPLPGLPDDLDDAPPGRGDAGRSRSGSVDGVADRLAIDEALAQLPLEFRAPVVLRDLCDLDYAEIAEVLDIPPGTVRSRIARGRAQLARLLEPRNQSHPVERPTPQANTAPPATGPAP